MSNDENMQNPPSPPLFVEDLGQNGGICAPISVADLQQWVSHEVVFWGWAPNVNAGPHRSAFDYCWRKLNEATAFTNQAAAQVAQGQVDIARRTVSQVSTLVREIYGQRRFPHSSTPVAKRIAQLCANPIVAHAYLYAHIGDPPGQNSTFGPANHDAWLGFIMGLAERYGLINSIEPTVVAQQRALDELREKATDLLERKKQAIESLERNFANACEEISKARDLQVTQFRELMEQVKASHEEALADHQTKLDDIKMSFRETLINSPRPAPSAGRTGDELEQWS